MAFKAAMLSSLVSANVRLLQQGWSAEDAKVLTFARSSDERAGSF